MITETGVQVLRQCQHCGRTGSDGEIGVSLEYCGGHGYVEQMLCRNRVDCWRALDEQQADFRALELRNDEGDFMARNLHDEEWLGKH